LNITPDHLDRYAGFEEYARAKSRITMNQQTSDLLIYNADDEHACAMASRSGARTLGFSITDEVASGACVRTGMLLLRGAGSIDPADHDRAATGPIVEEEIMRIDEIRIRGPHNLYNAMAAALAVRSLGVGTTTIAEALRRFAGVPHRLDPVRELDGISYVNDSKATNVDSLWYALSSFSQPIILIAGGRSKKNRYDAIIPPLRKNVRTAVLIGEAATEMEEAFAGATRTVRAGESMEHAVELARSIASPGDVILLSPACASFDMFDNYEHRGEVFKSIVRELAPLPRGSEVTQ
jgi:UDP-N-acetylmuramoylalanine--D-glutamate ligase